MPNPVKTKIAGLLRGLLKHLDENELPVSEAPRPAAAPQKMTRPAAAPVSTPRPVPVQAQPKFTPPPPRPEIPSMGKLEPAAEAAPARTGNELELQMRSIAAALPVELRARVMQILPPGTTISVPLEKILPQLPLGAVKITFGELRQAAPDLFASFWPEQDQKPVALPLGEILTCINPALLARRPAQKQAEMADNIPSPFGAQGEGIKISAPTKPAPPAARPPSRHHQSPRRFRLLRQKFNRRLPPRRRHLCVCHVRLRPRQPLPRHQPRRQPCRRNQSPRRCHLCICHVRLRPCRLPPRR